MKREEDRMKRDEIGGRDVFHRVPYFDGEIRDGVEPVLTW
jgi:hypothetical protein